MGDVMPAGECPECGANAMLDEQRQRMADLRPEMEALMLDLDQLHRNIYSGRLRVPIGAYVKQLADSARKALAAGPACSPRLQYLRRHERPGGRLGALGHALAALGAALHLRGDRHLRGLRPRVQLRDEAVHGGRVMQERSAFDFGGNRIVRQSEPMKIGKHEWRLTLYRSPHHEHTLIGYEWRRADGAPIRRKCPGGTYWLDGATWMRDRGLALLQPQRRRVGRHAAHAAQAMGTGARGRTRARRARPEVSPIARHTLAACSRARPPAAGRSGQPRAGRPAGAWSGQSLPVPPGRTAALTRSLREPRRNSA